MQWKTGSKIYTGKTKKDHLIPKYNQRNQIKAKNFGKKNSYLFNIALLFFA